MYPSRPIDPRVRTRAPPYAPSAGRSVAGSTASNTMGLGLPPPHGHPHHHQQQQRPPTSRPPISYQPQHHIQHQSIGRPPTARPQQSQQQQQRQPQMRPPVVSCGKCNKPLTGQVWLPTCCMRFPMCDDCAREQFGTGDPHCPSCRRPVTDDDDDVWDLSVKPTDPTDETPAAKATATYQPLFIKMNPSSDAHLCAKDLWDRNTRQASKVKNATKFVLLSFQREVGKLRRQGHAMYQQLQRLGAEKTQLVQETNRLKANFKECKQKLESTNRQIQEKDGLIAKFRDSFKSMTPRKGHGRHSASGTVASNSSRSHASGVTPSPGYPLHPQYDHLEHHSNQHQQQRPSASRPQNPYAPSTQCGSNSHSSTLPSKPKNLYSQPLPSTTSRSHPSKRPYPADGSASVSSYQDKRQRTQSPSVGYAPNPGGPSPYRQQPLNPYSQTQRQQFPAAYSGNPYSSSRRRQ